MNMFSKFSKSEKTLIALAAALCVILGAWQFVIKPIFKAKAQSRAQYEIAVRDYDIVQRALPRLTARAVQSGGQNLFNRSAVIDTARGVNIAISRVQPASNGEVQVWFDETTSALTYRFLQVLDDEYAVDIVSAQINRRQGGLISAQFTFMPITPANGT